MTTRIPVNGLAKVDFISPRSVPMALALALALAASMAIAAFGVAEARTTAAQAAATQVATALLVTALLATALLATALLVRDGAALGAGLKLQMRGGCGVQAKMQKQLVRRKTMLHLQRSTHHTACREAGGARCELERFKL
jgi:hypothetical protein